MKITELNVTVDHETPSSTWMDRLVLVSTLPSRLVGLVEGGVNHSNGFMMYAVTLYLCNLQAQIDQKTGATRLTAMPHGLAPYDGAWILPRIWVARCENVVHIRDLPEKDQEWFRSQYVSVVAGPSMIVPATEVTTPSGLQLVPSSR